MEESLEKQLKEKYSEVNAFSQEHRAFVYSFQLTSGSQNLDFEFKTGCFSVDFQNFCIFESILKLTIPELYPFRDPKWKEEYQNNIPQGLGEVYVKIEEECKKFVIRTVIHCLQENYLDMINELVVIHKDVHDKVKEQMNKYHKV